MSTGYRRSFHWLEAKAERGERLTPSELKRYHQVLDERRRRPTLHRDRWSRYDGTEPRSRGASPRQTGTNPRAVGTSGRGWLRTALYAAERAAEAQRAADAQDEADRRSGRLQEAPGCSACDWTGGVYDADGVRVANCSHCWPIAAPDEVLEQLAAMNRRRRHDEHQALVDERQRLEQLAAQLHHT